MNVYDVLRESHAHVTSVLDRFARSGASRVDLRRRLWKEAAGELVLHARLADRFVYPHLVLAERTRDLALASCDEHRFLRILVEDLQSVELEDARFRVKFAVLRENVERHAGREEDELFDAARTVIDEPLAERIGTLMADAARAERVRGASVGSPAAPSLAASYLP